jgi:hypothetical protein
MDLIKFAMVHLLRTNGTNRCFQLMDGFACMEWLSVVLWSVIGLGRAIKWPQFTGLKMHFLVKESCCGSER